MNMIDVGKRIKARRKEMGLSAEMVAASAEVSPATVYRYEKNEIANMGVDKLQPIADALNTTPAYLMGWTDDPLNYDDPELIANIPLQYIEAANGNIRTAYKIQQADDDDARRESFLLWKGDPGELARGLLPLETRRIPLLGPVAAGEPIEAQPEFDEYVSVAGENGKADAALRVEGDSMVPRYLDGDIVFVRLQPDVEDGEVAAVQIDDNVTLKHVYHIPGGVQLISDNISYKPMTFTAENADSIRIIGKAVGFQRWE